MGRFLNNIESYENYREMAEDTFFVDKTRMIMELLPVLRRKDRDICLTRPRRFGKSVMANMLAAFFGKAVDARNLFDRLEIAGYPGYGEYINQYNVIFIDFSIMPEQCNSYVAYIARISEGLKADLCSAYPQLNLNPEHAVWDILSEIFRNTREKFIFIFDEWDAVFHMSFLSDAEKQEFLLFLKFLLKGQAYVQLAYMTGVLPINKYSSGSELNMFLEYDMARNSKYSEYFGFTDTEIDGLFQKYLAHTVSPKMSREDLRIWYDGYYTAGEQKLYNPRSIVCALTDNELSSYWTSSGPYDEIFYYIRNNIEDVRDDLVLMAAGEGVETQISSYAAFAMELHTREEIYSAMVVYGLLTYNEGKVYIPNREIMEQLNRLLMTKDSLGYVYRLAKKSEQMLRATLSGDTDTMAEILEYAHDTESPVLAYNSEAELAAVVNLIYLSARDKYRVEREEKAGKGFADFIFYPERKNTDALILELKIDADPDEAIAQIENKNYVQRLRGKFAGEPEYAGKILLVGLCYNKKSKKHSCKVKVYEP